MNQYDIRTVDRDDPNTPSDVMKAMKKTITDATEKYETFEVTHDPINLKAKLVIKKQAAAAKASMQSKQDQATAEDCPAENDGTINK